MTTARNGSEPRPAIPQGGIMAPQTVAWLARRTEGFQRYTTSPEGRRLTYGTGVREDPPKAKGRRK